MSTVFLVDPELTLGKSDSAQSFFVACKEQLSPYVPMSEVRSEAALRVARPGNSDAVVIFNRGDDEYGAVFLLF